MIVVVVVVVVTAGLLAGLLAGRPVVDIRPGRTAVRGHRSPATTGTATTGTAVRPVILVVDDGYNYGLVVAILVLQQPINDPVYVAVRVGAAGLQRYRVRSVSVALFIWITRRRRRRCRYWPSVGLPGRIRSFRRGGRRTTVLRRIIRS